MYGVYALDIDSRKVETIAASAVVLATGGVGKVYRYTSNPDTSTGDGIAMAWRAGCRAANMSSSSSTPPACTTRRSAASSSPRRCAARARC